MICKDRVRRRNTPKSTVSTSKKLLVCGMESDEKLDILISSTGITSEGIIGAIKDHLGVKNTPITIAAAMNDVSQPNVSDAVKTLNEVAAKFERFVEIRQYECKHIRLNMPKVRFVSDWHNLLANEVISESNQTMNKEQFEALYLCKPELNASGIIQEGFIDE